jgi:hypothetical protein
MVLEHIWLQTSTDYPFIVRMRWFGYLSDTICVTSILASVSLALFTYL